MNIDRTNYEIYIVDYFDGKLDKVTAEELLRFLERNPDLQDDFEAFRSMTLSSDDSVVFEDKNLLKKTLIRSTENITESNYEDYFIGHTEKILSFKEDKELILFLALNTHLQKEFSAYQKTRLVADISVQYPAKAELKKELPVRSLTSRVAISLSVAASLLVIFISLFLIRKTDHEAINGSNIASLQHVNINSIKPISKKNIETHVNAKQRNLTNNADADTQSLPHRELYEALTPAINKELAQLDMPSDNSGFETLLGNRNEYTDILNYQKVLADSKREFEKENNGFQNLAATGLKKIRKAGGEKQPSAEPDKFSIWDLAYLGVAGYNRITNSNLILDRRTDNDGKLTSFALGRENNKTTEKK
ncbi:MAG: hypothetical protein WCM76_00345 [Bacteroidota bacterium]